MSTQVTVISILSANPQVPLLVGCMLCTLFCIILYNECLLWPYHSETCRWHFTAPPGTFQKLVLPASVGSHHGSAEVIGQTGWRICCLNAAMDSSVFWMLFKKVQQKRPNWLLLQYRKSLRPYSNTWLTQQCNVGVQPLWKSSFGDLPSDPTWLSTPLQLWFREHRQILKPLEVQRWCFSALACCLTVGEDDSPDRNVLAVHMLSQDTMSVIAKSIRLHFHISLLAGLCCLSCLCMVMEGGEAVADEAFQTGCLRLILSTLAATLDKPGEEHSLTADASLQQACLRALWAICESNGELGATEIAADDGFESIISNSGSRPGQCWSA